MTIRTLHPRTLHVVTAHLVFRLCDKVGWTKLRPIPDLPGMFRRHGGHCDKMNCSDTDCLHRCVPNWYMRLTGMTNFL